MAVVVDDAQWADRASLLALLFALRASTPTASRGRRHPGRGRGRPAQGLLRLVAGERGTTLKLRGLDAGELQEFAAGTIDECLPVELAEQLRDHSGGNPLHIRALLEELPWNGCAGPATPRCPRRGRSPSRCSAASPAARSTPGGW